MYIKACKLDGTTVSRGNEPLEVGLEVDFGEGWGYFVEDSPSIICGHPAFEDPYQLCYFEVEPRGEIESNFSDGTLMCRKLRIKRNIELEELKKSGDRSFNERCDFISKK